MLQGSGGIDESRERERAQAGSDSGRDLVFAGFDFCRLKRRRKKVPKLDCPRQAGRVEKQPSDDYRSGGEEGVDTIKHYKTSMAKLSFSLVFTLKKENN